MSALRECPHMPDGDYCDVCDKPPAEMTPAELNAAMAREVMGWIYKGHGLWWKTDVGPLVLIPEKSDPALCRNAWSPATDIAAAINDVVMEMRGKEPRGWRFTMGEEADETFARFHSGVHIFRCDRKPWPRAICEAALAAVRSEG